MCTGLPWVWPSSVNACFAWRDTSVLNGGILMKLTTDNDMWVRAHWWKGFQGQRSVYKVIVRRNALSWWRHTFRLCVIEAYSSQVVLPDVYTVHTVSSLCICTFTMNHFFWKWPAYLTVLESGRIQESDVGVSDCRPRVGYRGVDEVVADYGRPSELERFTLVAWTASSSVLFYWRIVGG